MRIVIAVLTISVLSWTIQALPSDSPDPVQRDVRLLRDAFEDPLRTEFEMRGMSKDDAAKASTEAIDWLVSCWRNQHDDSTGRTEETMVIRLGGSAIVTYAAPCMYEFLALVGVRAN